MNDIWVCWSFSIYHRFLFKVFHSSFHEIVLTQQICRKQVFHEFALKLWIKEWKPLLPIRFMNTFTATLVERYGFFFNPVKFWHFAFTIHIFYQTDHSFQVFFFRSISLLFSFFLSLCMCTTKNKLVFKLPKFNMQQINWRKYNPSLTGVL